MKTQSVQRQLIGDARKTLTQAAGDNALVSKTEAKKLPKDLQKAIAAASTAGKPVKVKDAVDAYAAMVSSALTSVDKGKKGDLTLAEAKKISDLALRSKVLDVIDTGATTGPGPVNRGQLDAAIEDLQTVWGDENIMDGHVGVATTIVAGNNAKDTAIRDLEALKGDDFDAFVGTRKTDGPRPLTKADLATIANAVNDDGFQYANRGEAARIRGELENVVKKLGGPNGLEVAQVSQSVKTERISDTDTFPAQAWTLRNARTGDAITITIRKGSL
jgi:hypothetical protein